MKKQTAVEYIEDNYSLDKTLGEIRIIIATAKEMEKQQIISARHNGRQDLRDNGAMYKNDDKYYNETYGK